MVVLKAEPEDFIVDEILLDEVLSEESSHYHLYRMKKRNYTTERAVTHIARSLHIPRKYISYAGTKDKQAVTTQYITLKGVAKEKVNELDLQDIELEFKGYARQALTLGSLKGNRFTIVLKDMKSALPLVHESFVVPNYFDEQRFSTNNVDIGLCILKGQFDKAVDLLRGDTDFGADMKKYLDAQKNDFVGALRIIPKHTLLFYVHSVQSLFFNELLSAKLRRMTECTDVAYSQGVLAFPQSELISSDVDMASVTQLLGYGSEIDANEKTVLDGKGLTARSFLVRSIPHLSLDGSTRKDFFEVKDFSAEDMKEDNSQKISFVLGKGSYATVVVKQLLALSKN